jgi:hypothetical protein
MIAILVVAGLVLVLYVCFERGTSTSKKRDESNAAQLERLKKLQSTV